jgi:hypothetical protein
MKVTEITPLSARCGVGPCPAVFSTDRGTCLIVGKVPKMDDIPRQAQEKIGEGEVLIEVPIGVLKGLVL